MTNTVSTHRVFIGCELQRNCWCSQFATHLWRRQGVPKLQSRIKIDTYSGNPNLCVFNQSISLRRLLWILCQETGRNDTYSPRPKLAVPPQQQKHSPGARGRQSKHFFTGEAGRWNWTERGESAAITEWWKVWPAKKRETKKPRSAITAGRGRRGGGRGQGRRSRGTLDSQQQQRRRQLVAGRMTMTIGWPRRPGGWLCGPALCTHAGRAGAVLWYRWSVRTFWQPVRLWLWYYAARPPECAELAAHPPGRPELIKRARRAADIN